MSYATKQDMIDRFGEEDVLGYTDRANPPTGVIDDDVLSKALEAATSEVNSRALIGAPVATVTEQIVNLTCVIARYHLYDPCPDRVRKDYEDAVAFLRMVSLGQAILSGVTGSTPQAEGNTPKFHAGKRLFTRDTMKGF